MRIKALILCVIGMIICMVAHAEENHYSFIGKSGKEGKTTFILELFGEDLNEKVQVSEEGELYIKVDRIISVSNETLKRSGLFFPNAQGIYGFEEDLTENRSKMAPKLWKCPYCGYWWELGKRCDNADCPTKQWEKSE